METSALESEEFAGKMCLTDCGVENGALMVLIGLMKNVAKSSDVRVDEGEGQRSEDFLYYYLYYYFIGKFVLILSSISLLIQMRQLSYFLPETTV